MWKERTKTDPGVDLTVRGLVEESNPAMEIEKGQPVR